MTKLRNVLAVFAFVLPCIELPAAAQTSESCSAPLESRVDPDGTLQVTLDRAWSGAAAGFDLLEHEDKLYVGYYDADRWLTVMQIDPRSGRTCKVRLSSRFAGWDAHNYVRLAFDAAGILHVAGNMHASPLVYARAGAPDSLEGFRILPMTGRQEQRVTYPFFVKLADRLTFMYRDGGSGNGAWYANGFEGDAWQRIGSGPIFTNTWKGEHVSAYPTYVRGTNGVMHFAIVWRRNPNVNSNVAISYVATRDFRTFTDIEGRPVHLPIEPDEGNLIDMPGMEGGLINNERISLDEAGRPVVVYHRYGADGRNEIVVARPGAAGWVRTPVAVAQKRTVYEGYGSLDNLPAFSGVTFNGSRASIRVKFEGEPWRSLVLDSETLAPAVAGTAERKPSATGVANHATGVANHATGLVNHATVAAPPGLRAPKQINVATWCPDGKYIPAVLSYVVQAPNGDREPDCHADAKACAPSPTPLVLKIVSAKEPLCPTR